MILLKKCNYPSSYEIASDDAECLTLKATFSSGFKSQLVSTYDLYLGLLTHKANVGDNAGAYVCVERIGQLRASHLQFGDESRRGNVDPQLAGANFESLRLTAEGFAHHLGPSLDKAVLEKRSFKAAGAQKLTQNIGDGLFFFSDHRILSVLF